MFPLLNLFNNILSKEVLPLLLGLFGKETKDTHHLTIKRELSKLLVSVR